MYINVQFIMMYKKSILIYNFKEVYLTKKKSLYLKIKKNFYTLMIIFCEIMFFF